MPFLPERQGKELRDILFHVNPTRRLQHGERPTRESARPLEKELFTSLTNRQSGIVFLETAFENQISFLLAKSAMENVKNLKLGEEIRQGVQEDIQQALQNGQDLRQAGSTYAMQVSEGERRERRSDVQNWFNTSIIIGEELARIFYSGKVPSRRKLESYRKRMQNTQERISSHILDEIDDAFLRQPPETNQDA